jgi:hypothetical protein
MEDPRMIGNAAVGPARGLYITFLGVSAGAVLLGLALVRPGGERRPRDVEGAVRPIAADEPVSEAMQRSLLDPEEEAEKVRLFEAEQRRMRGLPPEPDPAPAR